jgi:hypothetical protein
MQILENVFELIEEATKKKKEKTEDNKSESIDMFHERIKFNKWKKKILKNRAININVGGDKQLFGPHEKHIKLAMDKQKHAENQHQANIEKQQHDMQMAKLAPKPLKEIPRPASPNLASAAASVTNTHSKMAKDSVPKTKDVVPKKKEVKKLFTLSKGMEKNLKSKKGYKCSECGFPIIRYSGRYPKNCGGCGKPLVRK